MTVGLAEYRSGDSGAAIEALTRSLQISQSTDPRLSFLLAMAQWRGMAKERMLCATFRTVSKA